MPEPTRVLFVTTSLLEDGPTRSLEAWLPHLDPGRWACQIAVVRGTGKAARAGAVVLAPGRRGLRPAHWRRLRALCRQWRPSLVHTQLSRADWLGRLAAAPLGLPVTSTIQNVHSRMYVADTGRVLGTAGRWMDRLTDRRVARYVAVSAGVARDLERHGVERDRVIVVPNAIDDLRTDALPRDAARRALGVAPHEQVVIAPALLKRQKGLDVLISALARLRTRQPTRVLLCGEGAERSALARLAAALPSGAPSVELRGWVPQLRRLWRGADLCVLPSRWEGLPLALVEAMANGVPALATAVAGNEDVIVDEVTGWLVPPDDDCALADRLAWMIDHPGECRAAGGRAREDVVVRFSPQRVARQYEALFEDLLHAGAATVSTRSEPDRNPIPT